MLEVERASEFWKVTTGSLWFLSRAYKAFAHNLRSQCSACVLELVNVSSPDLPEVVRRPESVVQTTL